MSAERAMTGVDAALELVDAVRRWDQRDVRHILAAADLPAIAVALAAMVDDNKTLPQLLDWTTAREDTHDGWLWTDLLAAHAQYELCRTRGITPPVDVRTGQRVYDRVRARAYRARAKGEAA